jgi:hypothetical protein
VPKAVKLALAKGWLVVKDGGYSITPAGVELGKRSRVGHRKARLSF